MKMSTNKVHVSSTEVVTPRRINVAPITNNEGECNAQHLPIDNHQPYFDAIVSNDSEAITDFIKRGDNALVSGHFTYGDDVTKTRRGSDVHLPLAVAAVAGATNSILTLLHAGVSPQQLDCHGNNVLHSLVAFLHYNRQLETQILSKLQLLRDTVSADVMRQILHHENALGLRPLEFAAQHGQGSMVLAILNTPGVYLMKQQVVGLTSYKCYNITEYESTGSQSRAHKSPLLLMTYADEDCVDSLCDFVQHDLIKTWYRKKFSLNLPMMILWVILRLLFVLTYMMFDMDMSMQARQGSNFTGCVPEEAILLSDNARLSIMSYLNFQAIISLILSAIEGVQIFRQQGKPMLTTISGYKSWLVQTKLYKGCHISLCLIIFASAPLIFFEESLSIGISVADYIRVICPFMACWSLFYFVQILPGIGRFISAICKMMSSLALLVLVYFLMITPFIQSFYNFMNGNSLQGCIPGFNNALQVIYSLFEIMLNMINLASYEILNSGLLYATHMSYIFLVEIMLINFFVAVMAESFSADSERREAMSVLQKAEVAFSAESLMIRFLGRYYRYAKHKAFQRKHKILHDGDINEDELVLVATSTKL